MTNSNVEITPSTTVYDLLEAYPKLEDVLIGMAAPFKKLKNPLIRKSIAKIATIKNIASVGGIPLDELIDDLRTAVGQSTKHDHYEDENYFSEQPDWFSNDKIVLSVEEAKLENKGEMTIVYILREATHVKPGEIIELITTFLPAPGINTLKSKGYSVWTVKEEGGVVKSYFLKNS